MIPGTTLGYSTEQAANPILSFGYVFKQEARREVMQVMGLTEVHRLILGLLGPPYQKYYDSCK
jgi:hypothetical protein